MFERFTRDARSVVRRAHEEASALGSRTIEAEHLLLALSAPESGAPATVLADAGVDHDAVIGALNAELEGSLHAIGLEAGPLLEQAPPSRWASPRFAYSAKLALERALRAATARRDRRLVAAHILLGVLNAEHGTVPRALQTIGVERDELARKTSAVLAR